MIAAIPGYHRPRRHRRHAVASCATGLGSYWTRQNYSRAHGRFALAAHFPGIGVVAKALNDVGFPVGRSIARVRRIERRLLVAIVGVSFAKLQEILSCRIERYALRRKLARHPLPQQGKYLRRGIRAHRERAIHHEAGFRQNFTARVALEDSPERISRDY